MQKLVSRNPVQRFKEGKKLEFFQAGGKPWAGYYTGNWPKSGSTTPVKKKTVTPSGTATPAQQHAQAEFNRKVDAGEIQPLDFTKPVWPQVMANQWSPQPQPAQPTTPEPAAVQPPVRRTTPVVRRSAPSPVFYGTRAGGQVQARGNQFNNLISDDQRQKLIATGQFTDADFSSVKNLQTALNKYFAADGAGSIKVDNMWGNQTQKAFNLALSKAAAPKPIGGSAPTLSVSALTAPIQSPAQAPIPQLPLAPVQAKTYNRSDIRQLIRDKGVNPYSFTGDQRKALRMMMNGQGTDQDKAIVQAMGILKKLVYE